METITVKPVPNFIDCKNKKPKDEYGLIVRDTTLALDSKGDMVFYYGRKFIESYWPLELFKLTKTTRAHRSSGLITNSTTIGYQSESYLRHNPIGLSRLHKNEKLHHSYQELFSLVTGYFKNRMPKYYERQLLANERYKLPKRFLMDGGLYSSGILNKDFTHRYHKDSNNIPTTYSTMITYRKGVEGGWLHLPEYGITIKNDDNSVLIFKGVDVYHGVTPAKFLTEEAYRYTCVFYAVKGLDKASDYESYLKNFNETINRNKLK